MFAHHELNRDKLAGNMLQLPTIGVTWLLHVDKD